MDEVGEKQFRKMSIEDKSELMGYCWRPRWFERNKPSKCVRQPLMKQRDEAHTNFLVQLPVEIIRRVMEHLDIRSIFKLRLVDVATHDFVDSLHKLNTVLEHASDPLNNLMEAPPSWRKMAYHRMQANHQDNGFTYQANVGAQLKNELSPNQYQHISLLDYVTMGELYSVLNSDRCAMCPDYGPFLDIFGPEKQRFCYSCLFALGLAREYKCYGLSKISCNTWCVGMPSLRSSGVVEQGVWCRGCEDVYLAHFRNGHDEHRSRIRRESHRAFSEAEFRQHLLTCAAAQRLLYQFKSQTQYNNIYDFLCGKHYIHRWHVRTHNPGFPISKLPCTAR